MTPSPQHRLLRALLREPVDCTPVWLMRQAGRYLPEYRELRAKAGDFMTLCQTPELAAEVTLQPLRRFALDGAILFSDILTIPDAMGLGLYFVQGEGPRFANVIKTREDIENLPPIDPTAELGYVHAAIKLVKNQLANKIPLIGFTGSPWTLACYMVEGGSSENFSLIKKLRYENPGMLHLLLQKLAIAVADHLNAQIEAGVDAVMIFDTWGGILTTPDYQEFSLAYSKNIISRLTRIHPQSGVRVPCILFTKHGGQWLAPMLETGADALGLDWTIDIHQARLLAGHAVSLQGNLDPNILFTTPECVRGQVGNILKAYGPHPGHVFNLGHGVPQHVPPENVEALVNAVHELSRPYHEHYQQQPQELQQKS